MEFGAASGEPALHAYFGDDRLLCVAADAAHGPQVTLWGRELTGCAPADLERFLTLAHGCEVIDLSYGSRANPGSHALGLVLRLQQTAPGVLRTRPVLVAGAWANRCTDDRKGPVPASEWAGPRWPSPEATPTPPDSRPPSR